MADEQTADVLEQDGPTQENAEESEAAKTEKVGEQEPQATQEQGDDEGHKRLGGWQRKIVKLEREVEVWREQALKSQPAKTESAELTAPEPPDLETFGGTMAEFKVAQQKYAKDLRAFVDQERNQQDRIKQTETAVRTFGERISKLPEAKEVRKALDNLDASPALVPYLNVELAKLKNGPEVLREIMLDADNVDELLEFDRAKDGPGIQTMLLTVSRALRIAQRNSAEQEPAQTKAPKPATPLRKTSSTDTDLHDDLSTEEWMRRRKAQIAKKSASG